VSTENVLFGHSSHAALPVIVLKDPGKHAEQKPPFGPVNPALQVQAVTVVLELGAFAFVGHVRQVDEVLAPTAAEYVAVPQSVHAALPALVLYLPATHAVQAPTGPVLPAGQSNTHAVLPACETPPAPHEVQALAPVVPEYVPAEQSVHATLPLLVLYLPATHPEHKSPSAPVYPALHVQAVIAELELGEYEFEEQFKQLDKVLAPCILEYFDAGQSVHAPLPMSVLYFPTTQFIQAPGGPVLPAAQGISKQSKLDALAMFDV
jgi:hypothetical protein